MVVGGHLQAIVEVAMAVVAEAEAAVVVAAAVVVVVGPDLVSHAILNIEVHQLGKYVYLLEVFREIFVHEPVLRLFTF
jgi:hypothetical protein